MAATAVLTGGGTRVVTRVLREAGVKEGDAVLLMEENTIAFIDAWFGIALIGAIQVPVNTEYRGEMLRHQVKTSAARVMIIESKFVERLDALGANRGSLERLLLIEGEAQTGIDASSWEAAFAAAGELPEELLPELQEQDIVAIMYTSGTTGRPKGVANSAFAAGVPPEVYELMAAGMVNIGFPPKGRTLLCGPGYHSAQWAFSFFPLIGGSSVVMQRRFVPEEMLELIDRHGITNVHLVPTQFVRTLRVDEERKRAFDGSSLSFVLHGAAPCSPDVKRQMIEWWGPKITEYYGATEGGVVSMITAEEWLTRPGSVGKPMSNMTVRIVAEEGDDASTGGAGVIHVRNAMGTDFEYLGEPEKTAEAHSVAGFFTLGDIGYLDDEGYLFLSDRKIDMIISGGVNIYPAEIEGVLTGHPLIVDAAVFGVPNEEFGEEVKAALQLVPGTMWSDELAADVSSYVRERLAGYKVPRSWDVVDELPRSEAGKLLKRQIRAPYWEGVGRSI